MGTEQLTVPQLELLEEEKIFELLRGAMDLRLEASGVIAKDWFFYLIFDNIPHIGRIGGDLSRVAREHHLIPQERSHGAGYEDIAYDRFSNRFYLLIEAQPHSRGFMAQVDEYDEHFRYISSAWLDFPLDQSNKGLEGLDCIHREEQTYLLGLCEGNWCKGGAAGRRPGGGRIQIFSKGHHHWDHAGTIRLPESLWFEDYSGLAVAGDRIAVVSQASSALWVGRFSPSSWEIADEGSIYRFPRNDRGKTVYCNVEGISWITPDRVVVVSDRAKAVVQGKRCRAKDQSIHVFTIPDPTGLVGSHQEVT